jgi:hypothetical protein
LTTILHNFQKPCLSPVPTLGTPADAIAATTTPHRLHALLHTSIATMPPHSARHSTPVLPGPRCPEGGPAVDDCGKELPTRRSLATSPAPRQDFRNVGQRPSQPFAARAPPPRSALGDVPSDAMLWVFLRKQQEMDRIDTASLRQRVLHRSFLVDIKTRCEDDRQRREQRQQAAQAAATRAEPAAADLKRSMRAVVATSDDDNHVRPSTRLSSCPPSPRRCVLEPLATPQQPNLATTPVCRKRSAIEEGDGSDHEDMSSGSILLSKHAKLHHRRGPTAIPFNAFV